MTSQGDEPERVDVRKHGAEEPPDVRKHGAEEQPDVRKHDAEQPPDLRKHGDQQPQASAPADQPLDFDPYRFGRPERPVPPEFAPPGYTPPPTPDQPPYGVDSPYGHSSPYGPPTPYGQGSPYGQQPQSPYDRQYGSPYQPGPYGIGAPRPVVGKNGRGKAIAALVLGIASIVMSWLVFFDYILVVLAVVFGCIALAESRHRSGPAAGGVGQPGEQAADAARSGARGMAIAGLACAVVGAVLATILMVKVLHAVDSCGGLSHGGDSGFQQCLQDHL